MERWDFDFSVLNISTFFEVIQALIFIIHETIKDCFLSLRSKRYN